MNAQNESGKNTDWWFIYKLPKGVGTKSNPGDKYLYYDEDSKELALSDNKLDGKKGALYATLDQVFNSKSKDQGYIIYNDEDPDEEGDQHSKGHCKGILCFNKKEDSAMILLHSVPRFPDKGELLLPKDEFIYGQTFLCITLSDFSVAEDIAKQMLTQQNPEINKDESSLPKSLDDDSPLAKLYNQKGIKESKKPSTVTFKSKGGKAFKLVAKSKAWNDDFWLDLIGPELDADMDVETWRRGQVNPSKEKGQDEDIQDVMEIDLTDLGLKGYKWKYTKDHSKWGVSTKESAKKGKWVCIADINRMISQRKRGGGGICFKEPQLWDSLSKIAAVLHTEK